VRAAERRAGRNAGSSPPAPESADLPLRGRLLEEDRLTTALLTSDGPPLREVLNDLPDDAATLLLVAEGQTLTSHGLALMERALAGDVAFSFGLVSAGDRIDNPFAWSTERRVTAPVLIRVEALRRVLGERPEPEPESLSAALARAGAGHNVQAFVARDAEASA
jgi:hypothetical protein